MACPVCNGVGMVRTHDWERGGWETCPQCHPAEPASRNWLGRLWRWAQARYRLDMGAVCELSRGRGLHHDYPDSDPPEPWHFHTHECRRCGKEFTI